ncbi:flagellar biosynthetic protein FliO [Streptomyces sp. NP160]|uniref:flagellar biosynthetic protein FliO n=1 Tax=Streptomyces sp. NP160 TaxID=2586637 RepID=UPI0011190CE4|nr:flagellar biosynthetic protein FliO [Streptomyces sp. NP160]TNM69401.1 flagellar biosynthetic protein FliO [Streptomyces sp. NP160]
MDLLPLLLRVAVSLALVLGLVYALQRAAKRRSGGRAVDATRFTVLARQSLTRSAGVSVLRVGDDALVVGVTDTQVQLLARMPLADFERPATEDAVETAQVVSVREVRTPVVSVGAAFTPAAAPAKAVATVGATPQRGALAGSALSPATWTSALEVLRERTTRR